MSYRTRARGLLAEIDLSPLLVSQRLRRQPTPSARLACVYRARNASYVRSILQQCTEYGIAVGLWALDEVHPSLVSSTLGCGTGTRFALINRTLREMPRGEYDVVIDDDIVFVRNDLSLLLKVVRALQFDLAMPAHARASRHGHGVVRQRPLTTARLTTFVDAGPLLVVGPRWRSEVEPFPEKGMGWAVELDWYDLHLRGFRMGVVDSVTVRHPGAIGQEYSVADENRAVREGLAARGFNSWADIERTIASWRPWSSFAELSPPLSTS